jgi:hypothetical protein
MPLPTSYRPDPAILELGEASCVFPSSRDEDRTALNMAVAAIRRMGEALGQS